MFASPHGCLINNIVVQKGGCMKKFHDGGHRETVVPAEFAETRANQQQERPESFPAAVDQMVCDFRN